MMKRAGRKYIKGVTVREKNTSWESFYLFIIRWEVKRMLQQIKKNHASGGLDERNEEKFMQMQ